jgi:hypothetical protein
VVQPTSARQDFVLVRGNTTATVRVIDDEGGPVAGAEVVVSFEPLAADPDAVILFSGESDPSGVFVARTVPVGAGTIHWSAVARSKGRAMGSRPKGGGDVPVEVTAQLDPGATLVGEVVDGSGRPIAGAPLRAGEVEGPWAETATTGGDGTFAIAGAPHGAGLGIGVGGDWVLADGQDVFPVQTPAEGSPAPLRLVVEPAGTITGRVEGASGPVAGAVVVAIPSDRTMGRDRRAVSAADGAFVLHGLRSNTAWDLEARRPDHAPAFAEGVATSSSGVVLRMRAGGTIAGRVVDRDGRGVSAVEAYAHRISQEESTVVGLREHASVRSGPDGRYVIEHLNPGLYRVEVRTPARLAFSPTAAATQDAVVEDGATTAIDDTQLQRGGRLRIVVAAPSAPPWLLVSILPSGQGGAPHKAQLWAGKQGIFEMDVVEAGLFDVAAQGADIGYSRAKGVRIEPEETAEVRLEFAGREALQGTVVNADGQPVVGATVDVFLADAGGQVEHALPGRAPDNFSGNVAHTGEDGSFRLGGLAEGSHRLRVSKPGLPPVERKVVVADSGARDSDAITIQLPRGALLEVALAIGQQGADRVVLVETSDDGGHRASAITDQSGAAHFAALPPGRYRVGAIVQGVNEGTVALADGDAKHLVLASKESER